MPQPLTPEQQNFIHSAVAAGRQLGVSDADIQDALNKKGYTPNYVAPFLMGDVANPVEKLMGGGVQQTGTGIQRLGKGEYAGGAADILEGLGKTTAPLALPAAISNPGSAAAMLGLAGVGGAAGNISAQLAGATPDQARLTGDVTGLGAGALGGIQGMPEAIWGALKGGAQGASLKTALPAWLAYEAGARMGHPGIGEAAAGILTLPNVLRGAAQGAAEGFKQGRYSPEMLRMLAAQQTPIYPAGKTPYTPNSTQPSGPSYVNKLKVQINRALGLEDDAAGGGSATGGATTTNAGGGSDVFKKQYSEDFRSGKEHDAITKNNLAGRFLREVWGQGKSPDEIEARFRALPPAQQDAVISSIEPSTRFNPNVTRYRGVTQEKNPDLRARRIDELMLSMRRNRGN